jgi:type II secretory pathway pseudopilin PulG
MSGRRTDRGFSLWELVILMFVLAAIAAIAAPIVASSRRVARVQSAAALVAAELRLRAGRALRGGDVGFEVARDGALSPDITVNPATVQPPEPAIGVTDVVFAGGTGDASAFGRAATVAIVLADSGEPDIAYAVVAGRRGVVRVKRLADGAWEDWE